MGIESKLRNLQDSMLDAGWRIQRIPWTEEGRVQRAYSTPTSLAMSLGGLVAFLGSVFLAVTERAHVSVLGLGVMGLGVLLLGRLHTIQQKQRGWVEVGARCEDREVLKVISYVGKRPKPTWEYRLRCSFRYNDRGFTVTPELPRAFGFRSEASVHEYLKIRVGTDGTCKLWINPKNPLQTMFHRKQII